MATSLGERSGKSEQEQENQLNLAPLYFFDLHRRGNKATFDPQPVLESNRPLPLQASEAQTCKGSHLEKAEHGSGGSSKEKGKV